MTLATIYVSSDCSSVTFRIEETCLELHQMILSSSSVVLYGDFLQFDLINLNQMSSMTSSSSVLLNGNSFSLLTGSSLEGEFDMILESELKVNGKLDVISVDVKSLVFNENALVKSGSFLFESLEGDVLLSQEMNIPENIIVKEKLL